MTFDAKAIANYFLAKAREEGESLTSMKLQKLVYYAHGWNLAIRKEPLIAEQVEAWSFGPVIPSLYRAFKHQGDQPIEGPATYLVTWINPDARTTNLDDFELRYIEPNIDDYPEAAAVVKPLLDRIWSVYGKYTAIQLANVTHEPGSPWSQVYEQYDGKIPLGTDIPTRIIKEFFMGLARTKVASS